ncbi:MAG TPA: ABC transporter substrate-binding protein, partial [Thermoanaerobacterales bacterium]|nr:ABC transporter substrate-binding protein [Thermoanaerobacterales bacterium]
MRKKVSYIGLLLLLVVFTLSIFLTACGEKQQGKADKSEPEPVEQEPIKIGHEVALTGDASMWGQSEKNALEMEIEKINAAGGVDGRPLKLISYDNRADSIEAVNVAKRLIEQDKVVAIIGPAQSGVANAISSVTEEKKVPFIGTTPTNPLVTVKEDGTVKKYAFRTCFIDPFQGTVAAQFAYDKLNARTAAILYDVGSDYSSWLSKYFEEAFGSMGGKLIAKEAFRTGELDYRAMLGKIKQQNPDVLFIPTAQKEAALAAKQSRDLGIEATLMGGDNWGSPDLIELGGSAIEGGYFVNLADIEDPEIQGFVQEYRGKYNAEPVLPNPVMAIDGLYMLIDAI